MILGACNYYSCQKMPQVCVSYWQVAASRATLPDRLQSSFSSHALIALFTYKFLSSSSAKVVYCLLQTKLSARSELVALPGFLGQNVLSELETLRIATVWIASVGC